MVKNTGNIIVGISIGDLNGIGSEIILKTFEDSRMLELCTPVIFAGTKVFSFLNKTLQTHTNFFRDRQPEQGGSRENQCAQHLERARSHRVWESQS